MSNPPPDCTEFYRLRDSRTSACLPNPWAPHHPVQVIVGSAASQTISGQHLAFTLVNLLARAHRRLIVTAPDVETFTETRGMRLGDALAGVSARIDPCGSCEQTSRVGAAPIVLGVGDAPVGANAWYLGARRSIATLQCEPAGIEDAPGSLRGAGLAACLGAAAAFRMELGIAVTPRILSAWNYQEGETADPGPETLDPLDVGRVLVVGAGAVGSSLAYWLSRWGVAGLWTVVDPDQVELHNTSRSLLLLPEDAGWPAGTPRLKAQVVAGVLPSGREVPSWFAESEPARDSRYDVVLALANERDVRHALAHRNATVTLHATTGIDWLSQLHRHVAGIDDCIHCRLGEVRDPVFLCATGTTTTRSGVRVDAALPFLPAASALMLATSLQRLQAGALLPEPLNNWRWDFRSEHLMAAAGRSRCKDDCRCWYAPSVRARVNAGMRWAALDAASSSPQTGASQNGVL